MNNIKKRENHFVQVSNSFLRDEKISFKAKGLFCYMFSMSESWNFTIRSIATQQKDGYDSIKSALQELKDLNYISYTKHSNGKGTYFLDDEPKTENPLVGNPIMGKSTPIKKNQLIKNKNNTENLLLSKYRIDCNNEMIGSDETIVSFIKYRKEIKKPIKTSNPIKIYILELSKCVKAGYSKEEVIDLMKDKEWQSIKLDWIKKELSIDTSRSEWSDHGIDSGSAKEWK